MYEFKFPKIGNRQLIILACVFLIIIFGVLFTSKSSKSNINIPSNQRESEENGQNIPKPTPEILIAQKNIYYNSTSKYPPLFSVIIPKGAKYHQDGELLEINLENGLSVTICSTCQLFIPNCGGLSDGDVQEGGCAITQVNLGPGVTIGSHYLISDPKKILGSYNNYNNGNNEHIGVRVLTNNMRKLTINDKAKLYTIISSLK